MSDPVIRVVDVRDLRTREGRAAVCYCGRAWAGWPQSKWHNPFKVGTRSPGNHRISMDRGHVLDFFRSYIASMREGGTLDAYLDELWEACGHGAKPLGCWCVDSAVAGDGQEVVCHAQILAELLRERFGAK